MIPMRVLQIVGNSEGGGTVCVTRILRHSTDERYHMTLVAPAAEWLTETCRQTGTTYHPLPLLERRANAHLVADLRRIISDTRPDVISMHGTRAAWFTLQALGRGRRPALLYSEHLFSFDARRGAQRWPWWLIERQICRQANAVTTSCNHNATLIESQGWKTAGAIALRHYGIDFDPIREQAAQGTPRKHLGIASDALVVGTLARLVPQKGMAYWLDAAARVAAQVPNAAFVIVGDGELQPALAHQAMRLGIAERVHFLGASASPWQLLAMCDIVTFASLYEGLPQTALEALAVGMPMVATSLGGTREIIRDGWNGLLVPPRDARRLAMATCTLLANPTLRQQMRAVGPDSVAAYTTQTMIAGYHAAYERLISTRAASRAE